MPKWTSGSLSEQPADGTRKACLSGMVHKSAASLVGERTVVKFCDNCGVSYEMERLRNRKYRERGWRKHRHRGEKASLARVQGLSAICTLRLHNNSPRSEVG